MSIDTELARLTNAKAAIKAAIEGKGVTVPNGTLLDGMASLIEGIEAGGGALVATGSITPESDGAITITHNFGDGYNNRSKILGKTTILIVAASPNDISNGVYSICSIGYNYTSNTSFGSKSFTRWGSGYIHTSKPTTSNVTDESFSINNSNGSKPFVAGTTYHYAMWDNGEWKG